MFTAEDARYLALRNSTETNRTLEALMERIEQAARKGEWSLEIEDKLNPVLISLLQRQGYCVTNKNKGGTAKISWEV